VFTFIDVEEQSIDAGDFSLWWPAVTAPPIWCHQPADRHSRGANLGYADGHAAFQRWKWPKVFRQYGQETCNAQDLADLRLHPRRVTEEVRRTGSRWRARAVVGENPEPRKLAS